jgi:transposase-like protein
MARESAQGWRDLLLDLKRRGPEMSPRLVIADGALGFWKAASVWPQAQAALLGAHDRERARQAAQEPTAESQARVAGNLDGRNQGRRRAGVPHLHREPR